MFSCKPKVAERVVMFGLDQSESMNEGMRNSTLMLWKLT